MLKKLLTLALFPVCLSAQVLTSHTIRPQDYNDTAYAKANGVVNPAACSAASPPAWCSGSDMGGWINAAVQSLPASGGAIIVPQAAAGCYHFAAQIVIDRPVHLSGGESGFNGAGTCLQWTGSAQPAILINGVGTNGASSHSVLENFSLTNTGSGTVGIDIINGQYNVVLRHIVMETPFSVAGVRLGASGGIVIDTLLDDVRIAYQVVGLAAITANTVECDNCHIYNSSVANVQLGNGGMVNVAKFQGGNIEQDDSGAPSFIINNAQSVLLTDLYTELFGANATIISIPNTGGLARNISWEGGYVGMNGFTATVLNTANSDTTASLSNLYIAGGTGSGGLFANSAFTSLVARNIYSSTLTSISTTSSAGIESYNAIFGLTNTYMNGASLLGWKNFAGTGWDQLGRDSSDYLTWTGAGATLAALKLGGSAAITGGHGNGAKLQLSDNTGPSGNLVKFDANGNATDAGVMAASTVTAVRFCGVTTTCSNSGFTAPRLLVGTVTLAAGTATVTAMTAWTATTSFNCVGTDTTAAAAVKIVNTSTTSITVTGTGTDVVSYQCVGN